MKTMLATAVGLSVMFGPAADPVTIDKDLPHYTLTERVSADLRTAGSDTLSNVVSQWAQTFNKFHPGVRMQVEAKGSSTGPTALMENQAQFAAMSRAMKDSEIDAFVEKFHHQPTQLRVAIDCIAIYVNKDCPLDSISLPQLREIFSVEGHQVTWGELGVTDPKWSLLPISVHGRNAASGTYAFFKEVALDGSDYKPTVKEAPGSAGVIGAIATDPFAIGYSGVGFTTPDVKMLKLSFAQGEEAVEPTQETANDGEYALARNLYMYINYDRSAGLDAARREFIKMVYSREGQEEVVKEGFFPISAETAMTELEKVGLELPKPKSDTAAAPASV